MLSCYFSYIFIWKISIVAVTLFWSSKMVVEQKNNKKITGTAKSNTAHKRKRVSVVFDNISAAQNLSFIFLIALPVTCDLPRKFQKSSVIPFSLFCIIQRLNQKSNFGDLIYRPFFS